MLPNQIILLGGGASVRYLGALDKGLFNFIQNSFTIGINYTYKFFKATAQLGNDGDMYEGFPGKAALETWDEIGALPIWIGKTSREIKRPHPNSIFFKHSKIWNKDLKGGIYRGTLSGITAISLAIKLLSLGQRDCEIYLLGYDGGGIFVNDLPIKDSKGVPLTHFYQEEFSHRGNGRISWFQQTGLDQETRQRITYADLEMLPFRSEKDVKIINVNPISNITIFPKMDYDTFFTKQLNIVHNQDALRRELWEVLQWIKQENNI